MKISILAVGRCGQSPESELIKRYTDRIPWKLAIKEVEERRPIKGDERKKSEGAMLLAALPKNSFIIALDERGKGLGSPEFAKKLSTANENGFDHISFIIGGADGLSAEILTKAHMKLSFGTMVWPHMMVRAMLSEQIYRAWAILNHHPYHKE
ncbi:MAG: 23S rRNA (pseudouridine(1915)-N(3))-methyltransferase RlmH [Sphingomonadales bacterium]|nr:23S rRNA (pseudouridine(1915)-N(3))-methyltransferase RlmH [Sphingomonadales bacterium]